ncbi:alpha-2 adrenergic receptor isoform X3 [Eurosta solidaginis]|uniref:alpha-2 adrenergic receptor isoform X3 n=1 Tax=Eurosta solidaginis TaxID=178769 RepID=UPI00353061E4
MDYSQLDANINGNINTGNINTNDFLAIFTSTIPNNATLLNPPLITVEGTITTLIPNNYVNDSYYFLNSNFYNNSTIFQGSNYTNQTLITTMAAANLTSNLTEVHWDGRYPSGYTLPQIVVASVIVTILMIIIVVGNMLVIIAIATEKSLKNIQNWFIASLAVADFFLGLIIMPFSLANELMGYWIFGSWWCDIHSAMDVLLCTASIMNLCLISLDRYWSITKAVDYLKSRTPARAAGMIAFVWTLSALICIPPLLGWKVKMPEGPLPKCALSEDIGYVIYSACGSFYFPSCIMVFVYIRIYFAAKARARRGIKKHPRKTNNEEVTSFTTIGKKGTIPMPSSSAISALQMNQQRQIATIETPPNSASLQMQIPTVTCDLASDISTSEAAELEPHPLVYHNGNTAVPSSLSMLTPGTPNFTLSAADKESLNVSTIATSRGALNVPVPPSMAAATTNNTSAMNNNNNDNNVTAIPADGITSGTATVEGTLNGTATSRTTLTTQNTRGGLTVGAGISSNELRVSPISGRCRALSVGIDTDMPLKFRLCQPIFGRKAGNQARRNEAKAAASAVAISKTLKTPEVVKAELEPAIPKPQKPRDPEKEKRRIARKKEKRATLILGLIMGSFIACWLPFFFLYILVPACGSYCNIPDSAFAIAFWLGYMNSALNPAIYTIFNKDFRRAFRRILFK